MPTYTLYQIDAFTDTVFKGNPAAVIPLEAFPADDILQSIALENNLAETAFVVARTDGSYDLRWFTPAIEMDFCGHATIATAHALVQEMGVTSPITFHVQIGRLTVSHSQAGYTLYAPNYPATPLPIDEALRAEFGNNIVSAYIANNLYVELPTAHDVQGYTPDMVAITRILTAHSTPDNILGISIMAKGTKDMKETKDTGEYDFVSRHFCPLHGIDEDPVTGSAHSGLGPIWADKLNKTILHACQCSPRGGDLSLKVKPDTVEITGQAVTYLRGEIVLP